MAKAKVLKKETWWAGRTYHQGDDIDYDKRDISEMKIRHVLGEVELDEAEARLPPVSPPARVMTTENTSALIASRRR
jgi:hypothetical protein